MKTNLTCLVECLHSKAIRVFHVHLGHSRYDNILKKGAKKKALKARGWMS